MKTSKLLRCSSFVCAAVLLCSVAVDRSQAQPAKAPKTIGLKIQPKTTYDPKPPLVLQQPKMPNPTSATEPRLRCGNQGSSSKLQIIEPKVVPGNAIKGKGAGSSAPVSKVVSSNPRLKVVSSRKLGDGTVGNSDGKPGFGRVVKGYGGGNNMPVAGGNSPNGGPNRPSPQEDEDKPGQLDISLDPGVRPALDSFQRNLTDGIGLLPGEEGETQKDDGFLAGFAPRTLEDIGNSLAPQESNTEESTEPSRGGGQTRYGSKDSLIGQTTTTTAGTTVAPVEYTEGEGVKAGGTGATAEEYKGTQAENAANVFVKGPKGSEREQALTQALEEDDKNSGRSNGNSGDTGNSGGTQGGGTGGGSSNSSDSNPIVEHHSSSDGVVDVWKYKDGTVVVRNSENGTTTTQHPDGSTETKNNPKTGPTASIPKGDDAGAPLPPALEAHRKAMMDQFRAIGPKRQSGNIDPADDSATGTPVAKTKDAKVRDMKRLLLGGDRAADDTSVSGSRKIGQDRHSSQGEDSINPDRNN